MSDIIKLDNICKSYTMGENSLQVLTNVSLTVETGEFLSILGPSGSGKSTLMNIVGCMDKLDAGEYFLDDIAVHLAEEKEIAMIRNQKIGFIFQKYQLIPRYTVQQNVMLPLLIRGVSWKDAGERAKEQLELVGLDEKLINKPWELSGGQQQRVAIARALITNPAILLADEPTGALDSTTGKEVLLLFKKLHDLGNTIVMITHDATVASKASRSIKIVDGVIVEG